MTKRRKPKLVQVIPAGPEPMFQIVEPVPGDNYWHVRIQDSTSATDRPEFRCAIPAKSKNPFTIQEIAEAGARECAEMRGIIQVRRYHDGIPVEFDTFVANSRHVARFRQNMLPTKEEFAKSRWLGTGATLDEVRKTAPLQSGLGDRHGHH